MNKILVRALSGGVATALVIGSVAIASTSASADVANPATSAAISAQDGSLSSNSASGGDASGPVVVQGGGSVQGSDHPGPIGQQEVQFEIGGAVRAVKVETTNVPRLISDAVSYRVTNTSVYVYVDVLDAQSQVLGSAKVSSFSLALGIDWASGVRFALGLLQVGLGLK